MTDAELSSLESLARAATPGPWDTKEGPDFSEIFAHDKNIALIGSQHADAAFIAAANPAAILGLIADLRQTQKERDWVIEQIENGWPCPPTSDEFVGDCDKEMSCKNCWIDAAKEATKCQG